MKLGKLEVTPDLTLNKKWMAVTVIFVASVPTVVSLFPKVATFPWGYRLGVLIGWLFLMFVASTKVATGK